MASNVLYWYKIEGSTIYYSGKEFEGSTQGRVLGSDTSYDQTLCRFCDELTSAVSKILPYDDNLVVWDTGYYPITKDVSIVDLSNIVIVNDTLFPYYPHYGTLTSWNNLVEYHFPKGCNNIKSLYNSNGRYPSALFTEWYDGSTPSSYAKSLTKIYDSEGNANRLPDMPNCNDWRSVFYGSALNELSNTETIHGNCSSTFYNSKFTKLKLGKVSGSSIFANSSLLEEITTDASSFGDRSFAGCSSLKTINTTEMETYPSSAYSNMFNGCVSLVGGNGTAYSANNISSDYAHVDREGVAGYFTYNKATDYYKVDAKASDGIIYIDSPKNNFSKGSNITIEYEGNAGRILDYWVQYYEDQNYWKNIGARNPLNVEVLSNIKLYAVSKSGKNTPLSTYSVNLSSVPSNSCTLTGAGVYVAGDNVIITASPNEGYIFKQWEELINDTWVVLSDTKIFAINGIGRDRTIRAVCIKDTPDVAVSLTLLDDGNGTTFGSGRYLKGDKAEAAASAYAGYKFVKWTDELGNTVSASKVYTFIINKDTTLTANFAKDPYYNGGSSGTGGGGGNYDNESDIMGGANDKVSNFFGDTGGFVSVYVMDNKLDDFRNLLFGTSLEGIAKNVLTNLGSLGGKFTDYILNFFKLPIHINSMVDKPFRMGWYATDDRYPYTYATGATKNFGTIHITPYWGNALDYKSKIQIYLPYIGYEYLDTAEIMGKDISLSYNISYLDGSCVAQIYVDNNLKYQFNGNCAMQIPISEVNMAEVTQKALSLGASVITAGASAGAAASSLTAGNAMSNFDMPSTQKLASSELSKGNQMANKVGDSLQNAMFNVGGDVRRCSNLSGNLGMMSSQTPYIIISRPRLSMPDNYAHYHGYPSNITSKIGDLSGYTVVSSIHLEGLDATSSEIEELEGILKSGFIVK